MEPNKSKRIYADIEARSANGAYIYTAAWAIISFGTGFFSEHTQLASAVLFVFLSLGVLRIVTTHLKNNASLLSHDVWVLSIYVNILVPAFIMGLILSVSMVNSAFSPLFLYILMTIFAMISGGAANFSPQPKLSILYICTLIIPPMLTSIFLSSEHHLEGIMLLAYGVFMLGLSHRLSDEYALRIQQQFELERLNNMDSLTGVFNRRAFDKKLASEWNSHTRSQNVMSLIIIDIDYFKRINDQFGHPAGDEVIKSIANLIAGEFSRQTDTVARIGGEEYAVIVACADHEAVLQMAETIRQKAEMLSIPYDNTSISAQVSIGLASTVSTADGKFDELFKSADACLYQAKDNGRNQVVSKFL